MIVKTLEVRDRGTFIPVMAIRLGSRDEAERWLLSRAGYGDTNESHSTYVVLVKLVKVQAEYDEFNWGTAARTMGVAHQWIREHFDTLQNGSVVCVEHILGERETPKVSERL